MPRNRSLYLWFGIVSCVLAMAALRANPDDTDDSHDFPGWDRLVGYIITDYDEDNPSDYTFPVSRPTPTDSNHRDAVPVPGHRYVIRYEWNSTKTAPTVRQVQKYFEKVAREADYTVEKSSAEGDPAETFHRIQSKRQTWVYLVPEAGAFTLTVVESKKLPPPPAPVPVPPAVTVPSTNAASSTPPSTTPAVIPSAATLPPSTSSAITPPPAIPSAPATPGLDDPLYVQLLIDGSVVLPVKFEPGKPDLAPGAQPIVDRVIAIMKAHPDLNLTVEGHTDLTGNEDFNQTLSEQRAKAVRSLIVAGHINRKRLTAVGVGGTQPIADEGTAEGREKNRRIELVVRKGGDSQNSTGTSTKKSSSNDFTGSGGSPLHPDAPDGVNYYPKNSAGPTPP